MTLWQFFILVAMIGLAPHVGEKTAVNFSWLCILIALIAAITGATP